MLYDPLNVFLTLICICFIEKILDILTEKLTGACLAVVFLSCLGIRVILTLYRMSFVVLFPFVFCGTI